MPRKEPGLIVDVSGSNNGWADTARTMTKKQLATQIAGTLVTELAKEDSAAEDEVTAEGEKGGGLYTVVFADGRAWPVGQGHTPDGEDAGDLRPDNFSRLWQTVQWGGGTYIVPAVKIHEQHYQEEFGSKTPDQQPTLALAVLTDGMLDEDDQIKFDQWLARVSGKVYVAACVIGYGPEHDDAFQQWSQIASQNSHVIAFAANGATDAHSIAQQLLARMQ